MHHHGGEFIEEVLGPRRACGARAAGTGAGHTFGRGLPAAVGLHVEKLVEADVDSDLLPVVPPRPPEDRERQSNTELLVRITAVLLRFNTAGP